MRLRHGAQGDPPWHPAVAELHRQPGRPRCGTAVPERNPAAHGLRLDAHVAEREVVVGVVDVVLGEDPPQDLGVGPHQLHPVAVTPLDGLELVVEGARPEAENQSGTDQLGDRPRHQRRHQRVPERDQRAGPEFDALGHRADRGQRGQRIVEGAVRLLHLAVRLEHQMVANPYRVEADVLGQLRPLEKLLLAGVFAEVGQQQSELHVSCSLRRQRWWQVSSPPRRFRSRGGRVLVPRRPFRRRRLPCRGQTSARCWR